METYQKCEPEKATRHVFSDSLNVIDNEDFFQPTLFIFLWEYMYLCDTFSQTKSQKCQSIF